MKERNKNNYVDNKVLYDNIVKYKIKTRQAKDNNQPIPTIPDSIGIDIINISKGQAKNKNFCNYTFRDEMINDGIENAIKSIETFNVEKYDKPFAYFSRVIYFAFVRRIQKEKKSLYIKYKVITNSMIHNELAVNSEGVDLGSGRDTEYMKHFIMAYEESMERKKQKVIESKLLKINNIVIKDS